MILQVLVHIEDGKRFAVKTGEEHIDHKQDVQRLCLLALHTVRNVLVIGCEGIGREVGAIHLVIIFDDPLQSIAAVLILAFCILVLPIREDTGDVQVVLYALEDVIILDQRLNRRNGEDCGVLPVPCLCFMILDYMIGDERHTLFGQIKLIDINGICQRGIVPVKITLHRLYVFHMEAKDIVVKDSVFDQVVMDALPEQHLCGLRDFSFYFSVDFKAWRSCKAKELSFLEVSHNVLMHIAKLTSVALVDDKNNFLILVRIHDLCILRALDSIRHFLHGGYNKLPVFVLHLLHKDIGAVSGIYRAIFKLIKLFRGLRVQILAVNEEDYLFNVWIGCENLRRLEGSQRFSRAGCMPDIGIAVGQCRLPDKSFDRIYLIGTHDHKHFIRII